MKFYTSCPYYGKNVIMIFIYITHVEPLTLAKTFAPS